MRAPSRFSGARIPHGTKRLCLKRIRTSMDNFKIIQTGIFSTLTVTPVAREWKYLYTMCSIFWPALIGSRIYITKQRKENSVWLRGSCAELRNKDCRRQRYKLTMPEFKYNKEDCPHENVWKERGAGGSTGDYICRDGGDVDYGREWIDRRRKEVAEGKIIPKNNK